MAAEDFFSRWSRQRSGQKQAALSTEAADIQATSANDVAGSAEAGEAEAAITLPPPTEHDVQMLTPGAEVSRYMQSDVNEPLRRMALKKLFSDPHFNVMDGLDIYIDDYTQPDPLPEGMLAKLAHAQLLLNPVLPAGIAEADKANQTEVTGKAEMAASAGTPDDNAGIAAAPPVEETTISDTLAADGDKAGCSGHPCERTTEGESVTAPDTSTAALATDALTQHPRTMSDPSSAHRSESKTG